MNPTAYLGYTLTDTAYRWVEVAELHRWEVIDGWGDVDDTIRMTFLHEGRVPQPDAIKLETDEATFGPYDVETIDGVAGLDEVMVFGRVDRHFEETVLANLDAVVALAVMWLDRAPFDSWGSSAAIHAKIRLLLQSGTTLGDVRRSLGRYGLTALPLRTDKPKSADVRPRYPVDLTLRRTISTANIAHGARYKIPDCYNCPGDYARRPIIAGYRAPATGLVEVLVDPLDANPHAPDRLKLDIQQTAAEPAGFVINAKRWELQNTAATASVTLVEGDLVLTPPTLIDFTPYAESGLPVFSGDSETWRVTKAVHKGEGAAFETQLDLALWQGVPGRGGGGD